MHLAKCDFVMDTTVSVHQMLCKSWKSAMQTLTMTRQVFREESMSHASVFEWHGRPKNVRQVNSKIKSMHNMFFDIKGIIHKEFVLAGQAINSADYCDILQDCVKMCKDFDPNFGNKRTDYFTFIFSPGNILPKTTQL
jgi:hypothetical protein